MERLAAAYFPGYEDYLAGVAALHDVEVGPPPGTPAGVSATLAWMDANGSELKARLRWSQQQFETAKAVIMRTESPLTKDRRQSYRRALAALPPDWRALALRVGAILSEYADKASRYLEDPEARRFLRTVGRRESFVFDHRLAVELGLGAPRIPLIDEVLTRLSACQREDFKTSLARAQYCSNMSPSR
ncbi:MAG: hypothetical protein HYZ75_17020 [Elusimicrobia bacterium]|nr:hypothetical protein [Elusimicrobiota bacterium]